MISCYRNCLISCNTSQIRYNRLVFESTCEGTARVEGRGATKAECRGPQAWMQRDRRARGRKAGDQRQRQRQRQRPREGVRRLATGAAFRQHLVD
jgi:hypothetical protein